LNAFDRPVLSLVIDRQQSTWPVLRAIEEAARGGVDQVQIRERTLEAAELLAFARAVRNATRRGAGRRVVEVIVNRRVDIALALPADGVHLGFDAIPTPVARCLIGAECRIGVSTHDPEEVKRAARTGADYVHLAPIHAPLSKPATRDPLGLSAVREASSHGIAVLAQGGIQAQHCAGLLHAGAAGVAVTGSILLSPDPGAATVRLRAALDG